MSAFLRNLKDADLMKTKALPAAAAATTATDAIDTGARTSRAITPDFEIEVITPDFTTTILPDTKTCTMVIEADNDSDFGSPTALLTKVFTGAGGAGSAGSTERIKAPQQMDRYVRAKWTLGADTTTAAALTGRLNLLASSITG